MKELAIKTGAVWETTAVSNSGRRDRNPRDPVAVLGVPFDNVTVEEALDSMESLISSQIPHYVVTANVDFLVQAREDVELKRILLDADMVLCDGTPLVWASRFLGNPLPERVAGADLVPLLLQRACQKNLSVFFLGAGEGVALRAAENLHAQYPELDIVGHYSPPYHQLLEMNHEEISSRIHTARPDILLVSFGCPKQEKWIAMHYRNLGVPLVIGVGATIDFLAGRVKRAPMWMQKKGLEWAYRLWQEPGRLYQRYAHDLTAFIPALVSQAHHLSRGKKRNALPNYEVSLFSEEIVYIASTSVHQGKGLTIDAKTMEDIMRTRRNCVFDMSAMRSIDSTDAAVLIRLQRRMRNRGHQLFLLKPRPSVQRSLRCLGIENEFQSIREMSEALTKVGENHRGAQQFVHPGQNGRLRWSGDIVAHNAETVLHQSADYLFIEGRKHKQPVIDLKDVRFIDSTALGVMLKLKNRGNRLGMEVSFENAAADVFNVIRLANAQDLLGD